MIEPGGDGRPLPAPPGARCCSPTCGLYAERDGLCFRHWLERARAGGAALRGRAPARLFPAPLRPLTRKTTRGFEVIEFADQVLGEPLLPWQEWFVKHALELNRDGSYRFRILLLLVARQNGKTHVKKVINLWKMYLDDVKLILGVGQDVSLAREIWQSCIDTIKGVPDLAEELETVRRTNGDEWYRLTGGARYKISAANRGAGRGLAVDALDFEELREQRDWAAWAALSKTTNARANAQILAASNMGDDQSVVLNHLRQAALAGADSSIGLFEWSAEEDCALDDPVGWAQANPALGHTVSEAAIRSSMGSDPPEVFRAEVLCQRVDQLDGALDFTAWRACKDPAGSLAPVRDRIVLCLDVSPDGKHVALAGAAVLDDGRARLEMFAAWASTNDARRELRAVLTRVGPAAMAWFPTGPAAALAAEIRGIEDLTLVEVKGTEVHEACMGLAELVVARRVLHPGDPLLDAHVAGASKLVSGDGWRFTRRGAGHVSAAYAAAGAVHVARTLPVERPVPRSAIF